MEDDLPEGAGDELEDSGLQPQDESSDSLLAAAWKALKSFWGQNPLDQKSSPPAPIPEFVRPEQPPPSPAAELAPVLQVLKPEQVTSVPAPAQGGIAPSPSIEAAKPQPAIASPEITSIQATPTQTDPPVSRQELSPQPDSAASHPSQPTPEGQRSEPVAEILREILDQLKQLNQCCVSKSCECDNKPADGVKPQAENAASSSSRLNEVYEPKSQLNDVYSEGATRESVQKRYADLEALSNKHKPAPPADERPINPDFAPERQEEQPPRIPDTVPPQMPDRRTPKSAPPLKPAKAAREPKIKIPSRPHHPRRRDTVSAPIAVMPVQDEGTYQPQWPQSQPNKQSNALPPSQNNGPVEMGQESVSLGRQFLQLAGQQQQNMQMLTQQMQQMHMQVQFLLEMANSTRGEAERFQ